MTNKDLYIRKKLKEDNKISNKCNDVFKNFKCEEVFVNNKEKKIIKIGLRSILVSAAAVVIVLTLGINFYAKSQGKPNLISSIEALIKKESKDNKNEIITDTLLNNSYNTKEGLGWKATNLTKGYLVKVYENKEITIEFNRDIYNVVNEQDESAEMEMNIEYKIVGYSGEEKQVHVLQGRGTWPTVVVINNEGEVYIGKSNNMRYNPTDKTAIVSKCSIGNVLSVDTRKDESIEVTTDKTKYTINWDTLSDFELIGKVKEEIERTYKIMLNSTPNVSRYSDGLIINGRGVIEKFIMQFDNENCKVIGYTSYDNNGNIKIVNTSFIKNEQNNTQINDTQNNNATTNNSNNNNNINDNSNNNDNINVNLLFGDVNCDGIINNKDLTSLRKYINGDKELTKQGKMNADVNDDGFRRRC